MSAVQYTNTLIDIVDMTYLTADEEFGTHFILIQYIALF